MGFVNFRENIHPKSPQMHFEQSFLPEIFIQKNKINK